MQCQNIELHLYRTVQNCIYYYVVVFFKKIVGNILTYKDDYQYKLAVAFMMAQDYGFKRVMSSYDFNDSDQGPPGSPPNSINQGSCGNGWVCEHRWSTTVNMAKVRHT